jgi:hypothetical protein
MMEDLLLTNILKEIDEIANAMIQTKDHIAKAQATCRETGVYADADWYRRARTALAIQGQKHQKLLRAAKVRRAELKREATAEREESRAQLFLKICKNHIPKELYLQIWQEVDATWGKND